MARLIISILICAFFSLRDLYCYHFYPEMKTDYNDWCGANALTMNLLHLIIGLSVVKTLFKVKYEINYFFDFLIIWFCTFDLFDRSMKIYKITEVDVIFTIPASFILAALTHIIYVNCFRKKIINE